MRRKKIIFIVLILSCIVFIIFTIHFIKNRALYKLEAEIKAEFDNVNCIEISGYGPDCYVNVYVDKECCEFEDIESIFIELMLKLNEEDNYKYIEKRQSENVNGVLAFLHICFYEEKGMKEDFLFEFTSYKDFETWKLETWRLGIEETVIYNVSDYK